MKYGLPSETINKIRGVFARFPAIEKAVLYGSRAKGNYKPGSDIDLTLYGAALTSDMCATIADALDDLLLPYKVDLSIFDKLDHAKLREHIERVGVVFYERKISKGTKKSGWEVKRLGEVCAVVNGGTPKTGVSKYWGGIHQWITPAEMGKRSTPYIAQTERSITDEGLQNSSARLLPPHSVILSSRAPIGHLVINLEPMATNQGCKGLIPHKGTNDKFLFYYLTSIVELLNSLGTGATFKELSGGKLKEVPVPLPPPAEQQRIVAILDEAFEAIATAKANAEKNLQNVRTLFESILDLTFSERSGDWAKAELGSLCEFENGDRGTNYPSRSIRTSCGIPFINAGHLAENGLDFTEMDYIPPERFDLLGNGKVKAGDILFCLRGSLGKFASVNNLEKAAIASSLVILRPNPHLVLHDFVLSYLESRYCASMIEHYRNGAAQPNLSAGNLKKFLMPLPSLDVQKRIAADLAASRKQSQNLRTLYQQKLTALDDLKKSLLHQAFNGEL